VCAFLLQGHAQQSQLHAALNDASAIVNTALQNSVAVTKQQADLQTAFQKLSAAVVDGDAQSRRMIAQVVADSMQDLQQEVEASSSKDCAERHQALVQLNRDFNALSECVHAKLLLSEKQHEVIAAALMLRLAQGVTSAADTKALQKQVAQLKTVAESKVAELYQALAELKQIRALLTKLR
jgi:hypothetical protein